MRRLSALVLGAMLLVGLAAPAEAAAPAVARVWNAHLAATAGAFASTIGISYTRWKPIGMAARAGTISVRIVVDTAVKCANFTFAHARTGMFLPLLLASKVNSGAKLIGRLVDVYTSSSVRYTCRITQVRRHVKSFTGVGSIGSEQLWLQTSEGPNLTYPKIVLIATRIAVVPTTYAAAHPAPHPLVCG